MKTKKLPRGFRNNNPLNIRKGNNWRGEIPNQTDGQFEQFSEMIYGLRAGIKLIKNYMTKYKANTIRKIITRWAPNNENDTAAYIDFVSQDSGISPDTVISFSEAAKIVRIVSAMVQMENGQRLSDRLIITAYYMI